MTDPELADATYVEPLTPEFLERIIERERPDAHPAHGRAGRPASTWPWRWPNAASWKAQRAARSAPTSTRSRPAEDRELFKTAMLRDRRRGAAVRTRPLGRGGRGRSRGEIGLPVVVRPSFTLGGSGGGIAYNRRGLPRRSSPAAWPSRPSHEVLVEESPRGWKEFELEVMRDTADNVIIVCSIENFDPMGVHTGDSITVAPPDDASDRRVPGDARRGQGDHPQDRRRDRRLEHPVRRRPDDRPASRHRDEPARLALVRAGLEGDGLPDRQDRGATSPSATRSTRSRTTSRRRRRPPSSPRSTTSWSRSRAGRSRSSRRPTPGSTIQMKSVGEAMAIGRTFTEALQGAPLAGDRARRPRRRRGTPLPPDELLAKLRESRRPSASSTCAAPSWPGMTCRGDRGLTQIDPWFLDDIRAIVETEDGFAGRDRRRRRPRGRCGAAKRLGFSDRALAGSWAAQARPRSARAARSSASSPSTRRSTPARPSSRRRRRTSTRPTRTRTSRSGRTGRKVMILGGGPNRIGQGIEFDYCCVHACSRWARPGSRRSWSTATPRRSRPTTTRPTASTSSR